MGLNLAKCPHLAKNKALGLGFLTYVHKGDYVSSL